MQKPVQTERDLAMNWFEFEFFTWIPAAIRSQAVKNDDWQSIRRSMLKTSLKFKYQTLQKWLEINRYSQESKIQTQNYMQALRRGGLIA